MKKQEGQTSTHFIPKIADIRSMRCTFFILCMFVVMGRVSANDGAYFASGNQLIPIVETDISVKKEVLTIVKEGDWVNVTEEYEFFNPGKGKTLLVGFEAPSPSGDVYAEPVNGMHPYINKFTVLMNGSYLDYNVAIVQDSVYHKNGKFIQLGETELTEYGDFANYVDFYYVYHFNASFRKGLNKVKHTYRCKLSSSVMEYYSFEYILTAANRWANNQIDDFTLILDVGIGDDLMIVNSFFDTSQQWDFSGVALKYPSVDSTYYLMAERTLFYLQKERMIFKQKDFKPNDELIFFYPIFGSEELGVGDTFNYKEDRLFYGITDAKDLNISSNLKSYKILRNLPYARRGYVFKTKYILDYYEKLYWYKPNANYQAKFSDLNFKEREWLHQLKPLE